eukprot:CAMPEP_0174840066 /NCGR_PEP_ID=MMETSP1114-20130205/8449_1 /TAXON_ID=312471 /ORGANISM="Neobodo designis, Strain CCAP 1951/1" /LENGTH=80 /DNA_ID=CAMNT_0016074195 /DNA_START=54 /DNA_END=292 /DNA_ORIENTATION=-
MFNLWPFASAESDSAMDVAKPSATISRGPGFLRSQRGAQPESASADAANERAAAAPEPSAGKSATTTLTSLAAGASSNVV